MTLVIVALISSDGFISKDGNWASLITKDGLYSIIILAVSATSSSSINLLFNFAVIIGLIITSLVIAKKTSTEGSSHIKDATDKFTTFAGGAVMGGMGRAGRNTLGRLGNRWVNDKDLQDRAANGDLGARMRLATADKMAKSSFDVRATDGFSSLSKQGGLNFGKVDVKKENFQAIREEQNKKIAEGMKLYKPSDVAVEEAKKTLEDKAFKEREEEARKEWMKTDEYKNDERVVKETAALGEITKLKEQVSALNKDKEEKRKEIKAEEENLKKATNDVEKEKIRSNITRLELQNSNISNEIKEFKEEEKKQNEIVEKAKSFRENWLSKEKTKLIAMSGGQDANKDGQLKVESVYKERVDRLAATEEHSDNTIPQKGWRVVANTNGTAIYMAGMGPMPKTKTDREAVARKMRAEQKGKKKISAKEFAERGVETPEEPAAAVSAASAATPPPATPPTP
jgi:hypothetical protein